MSIHSKTLSRKFLFSLLCLSTTLQGMPAYALDANALPDGGVVVGGSASFDYSTPNELHVQQNTDKAVINWNSFNIGQNATTEFHQNNSNSIAVNRVTGAGLDPTQIMGTLKANGRIVVLDRNGVIFGKDSQVNVGGIIASTGNIDDNAFMNSGKINITGADTGGSIVNNGTITVREAGLAAFVSPNVKNNGVINAKLGKVTLAAGDEATVDLYGDGLVELAAGKKLTNALIENTGTINAEGGTVTLTASGAKDIVNTVINTSGLINVSSVSDVGGKIVLEGANTEVSGTLDASGKKGGGTILVGGDYQGQGTVKTANKTTITKTAKIKANTTGETGKGGKVIVWADDSTKFDGTIEAKGGYVSGDGGFVETSGKINLGVTGEVDASAYNGLAGSWLLDPSNVIIVGTGGNNIPGSGGTVNPTTDDYQISASSIQSALNSGNNVTITTTRSGTQDGNITTSGNVNINKTAGGDVTLTLQAHNDISLDNTTISSTNSRLNLNLTADSDSNGSGAITLGNVNLSTNDGDIHFNKAVTLTNDNFWNAKSGWIYTDSTVNMGTNDLTITAADMEIGGMISGTGDSVLSLRPDHAGADIGVNAGYGFRLDLTEAGYLNPGGKLIIGYADGTGTGYSNISGWDLTGKDFDLELYNQHYELSDLVQGDGKVTINSGEVYIYTLTLGSKDFIINATRHGSDNGYIRMQNGAIKNAAGESTLTMKSDGGIYAQDITSTGGALNVVLWTDADNTKDDGSFDYGGDITSRGGNIYFVGGLDDGSNGGVAGDGIGDGYMGPSVILWDAQLNAGGGDILVRGSAFSNSDYGLYIGNNSTLATTGTGTITLLGIGNTDHNGLQVNDTHVTTELGAITLDGRNTSSSDWGTGYHQGSSVVSSTDGNIYITGIRTNVTGGTAYGIELYGDNSTITSVNGDITITGTQTSTTNGTNSVGIHSWGENEIYSQHGDVTLNASATATTGTAIDWVTDGGSTFKVGNAASTGDITLNLNSLDLRNQTSVTTQGSLIIKPRTATTSIGISGGAGTLDLSDTLLSKFSMGTLIVGDSVNGAGDIDVDSWDLSAGNYNVELYGNDIDLGGITLGNKNFLAYAKDAGSDRGALTVSAAITKTTSGSSDLTLLADHNIVSSFNIGSLSGALDVVLNADRNGDQDGAIISGANITTRGGNIYLVGGLDNGANGGVAGDGIGDSSAANITLTSSTLNAQGGNIIVKGAGNASGHGVSLASYSSLQTSGNGNIDVSGTAGNANNTSGIRLNNSEISTENGTITLNGYNNNSRTGGDALYMTNSKVYTTGLTGGSIDIDASKIGTGTGTYGINLDGGNEIKTAHGDIDIYGYNFVGSTNGASIAIRSNGANSIYSSGSGNVAIDGDALSIFGTRTDFMTEGTGAVKVGDAASTGDISLDLRYINFTNTNTTFTTQGDINFTNLQGSIGLSGGAGELNLSDAILNNISAGRLNLTAATDINVDTWDLSGKSYDVNLEGDNINLAGITLGSGDVSAHSGTDIHVSSAIDKTVAGSSELNLTADNDITVDAGADIASTSGALDITMDAGGKITVTDASLDGNGGDVNLKAVDDVSYTSPDAITVTNVEGKHVLIRTTGADKDVTLKGQIKSTGSGNAITVAATGDFINDHGSNVFNLAGGGRWLVYSTSPDDDTRNGISPSQNSVFNATYLTTPPSSVGSGNRFVFSGAYVAGFDPIVATPPVTSKPIPVFDTVVANMSSSFNKTPGVTNLASVGSVNLQSFSPFLLSVQYAPLPSATDVAVDGNTLHIK